MCTCVGVQDFCADMKPCWSSLGPVWSSFESVLASLRMCGASESLPPSCHRPAFFCLKPFWGLCETACTHGCRIRLKKFSVTPQGVVAVRHINCSSCTLMAALLNARCVGANGYPLAGRATAPGTRHPVIDQFSSV